MIHPSQSSAFLSRLNRFLIIGIVVTGVAHFLVITALSTKGFVFKDLKSQANELTAARESMESQISSLGSYQSMGPRIQALHLVSADTVAYVSWDKYEVAKK